MRFIRNIFVVVVLLFPIAAYAQGTKIAFGNVKQDTTQPVEVSADNLAVNQNDGTAVFTGNVLIGQGQMRLSAPKVQVFYNQAGDRIERMKASGGVTLVSGEDAAEASQAEYSIDTGMIHLTGDVMLVQARSAITAERMVVDTKAGTANMQGRVKTVLQQQKQ